MKTSVKKIGCGLLIIILGVSVLLIWVVNKNFEGIERHSQKAKDEYEFVLDKFLQEMIPSNIAFNAPDSMELDESSTIQLLLNPSKSVEELENMITVSGEVESHQIKVSPIMQARLTGNGFQITTIIPEEQPVSKEETTEWKWEIKPIQQGIQQLHLTLSAIIHFKGEQQHRSIRTFNKTIIVKVSLGKRISDFLSKNWQWLWTALLIPIFSWLWNRKKSGKKKKR